MKLKEILTRRECPRLAYWNSLELDGDKGFPYYRVDAFRSVIQEFDFTAMKNHDAIMDYLEGLIDPAIFRLKRERTTNLEQVTSSVAAFAEQIEGICKDRYLEFHAAPSRRVTQIVGFGESVECNLDALLEPRQYDSAANSRTANSNGPTASSLKANGPATATQSNASIQTTGTSSLKTSSTTADAKASSASSQTNTTESSVTDSSVLSSLKAFLPGFKKKDDATSDVSLTTTPANIPFFDSKTKYSSIGVLVKNKLKTPTGQLDQDPEVYVYFKAYPQISELLIFTIKDRRLYRIYRGDMANYVPFVEAKLKDLGKVYANPHALITNESKCAMCYMKEVCRYEDTYSAFPLNETTIAKKSITFTKSQQAVIDFDCGEASVISGAGSGKTSVMTARMLKLAQTCDPSRILAITFTEKGVREIKEKLQAQASKEIDTSKFVVSTFNGLGYDFVRNHWKSAGFTAMPNLIDPDKQTDLVAQLIDDAPTAIRGLDYANPFMKFNGHNGAVLDMLMLIEIIKRRHFDNCKYSYEKVTRDERIHYDALLASLASDTRTSKFVNLANNVYDRANVDAILGIVRDYNETIHSQNLIDYQDQISLMLEILRNNTDIAEAMKNRFDHIIIDEFQDTSDDQMEIIEKYLYKPSLAIKDKADDETNGQRNSSQDSPVDKAIKKNNADKVVDDKAIKDKNPGSKDDVNRETIGEGTTDSSTDVGIKTTNGRRSLMVCGDDAQSIFGFRDVDSRNLLAFTKTYPKAKQFWMVENFRSGQEILDLANDVIKVNGGIPKRLISPTGLKGSVRLLTVPQARGYSDDVIEDIAMSIAKDKAQDKPLQNIAALAYTRQECMKLHMRLNELDVPNIVVVSTNVKDDNQVQAMIALARFLDPRNTSEGYLKYAAIWLRKSRPQLFDAQYMLKEYVLGESAGCLQEFQSLKEEDQYDWFIQKINDTFETKSDALTTVLNRELEQNDHSFARLVDFLIGLESKNISMMTSTDERVLEAVTISTVHSAKGREWDTVYLDTLKFKMTESNRKKSSRVALPGITKTEYKPETIRLAFVGITRAKTNLIMYAPQLVWKDIFEMGCWDTWDLKQYRTKYGY